MKSRPIGPGQNILASQNNDKRDDARGGSFLFAHQQLGVLALGTEPTNGQVVPIVINGTTITVTAVTSIGSTANNVLIGGSALAFVTNLVNFLRRPDLTTSTQVAASSANQTLLSYVGWAWPGSSTNIVPFSLNKNVNGLTDILTSFNITGITVTSGSWTSHTMQLYIQDGTYFLAGTRYLFTGGSTPTVTAPSSHPRIDVLTIDTSGTLAWTTGTENSSPVAPSYPTNKIPICELYNVVGETGLFDNENQQSGQGYILNDVRPGLTNPYGLFILDPGSEAQGDTLYYNGAAWVRLPAGTAGYTLQTQGASANPQWVLAAQTATIKDVSGQNASIQTNDTYATVASYSSIPAIATNQTIQLRGCLTTAGGLTITALSWRIQMNGTTIITIPGDTATSAGQSIIFDAMITVPTPASSQYGSGYAINSANGLEDISPGAIAANLSSSFTLTVQCLLNAANQSQFETCTVSQLFMLITN